MSNVVRTYKVQGMTCGHCRSSVIEEVGEVSGTEAVEVDLEDGRLTVSGTGFSDEAIKGAVEVAGYELVATA